MKIAQLTLVTSSIALVRDIQDLILERHLKKLNGKVLGQIVLAIVLTCAPFGYDRIRYVNLFPVFNRARRPLSARGGVCGNAKLEHICE